MALTGGNLCFVPQEVGYIEHLEPANPALGAQFTYTIPAGWVYSFLTAFLELVTDVTAINRYYSIVWASSSGLVWRTGVQNANLQTASLHWAYSHALTHGDNETRRAVAGMAFSEYVSLPLADINLLEGGLVYTNVVNLQAGDQIQNVSFCVQRWRV